MNAETNITQDTTGSQERSDKTRAKLAGGLTAKASCRKCYGRGYVGRNDRGQLVRCTCVKAA